MSFNGKMSPFMLWAFNKFSKDILKICVCLINIAKVRKHEQVYQLGLKHLCVILSHRRDSITSVWYFVITSLWFYHRDVILHKFQLFKVWKKLRIFFAPKLIWNGNLEFIHPVLQGSKKSPSARYLFLCQKHD